MAAIDSAYAHSTNPRSGKVQRTIYPASESRIDRNTLCLKHMPQIRLYATKIDLQVGVTFLTQDRGFAAFQLWSDFDSPLLRYQSVDQLFADYPIGRNACEIAWWHPLLMPKARPKRVSVDPKLCDGKSFRYHSIDFAMIQLSTGIYRSKKLTPCEFGLVTQKYYQDCGGRAKINWRMLNAEFNSIRRHLETISVGKVDGCLVMPDAYRLVNSGAALTESTRAGFDRYGVRDIKMA
jgi:hypothetical protein